MINALAILKGNHLALNLKGNVYFYEHKNETLVKVEVYNLPPTTYPSNNISPIGPFGFHIHDGDRCEPKDTFELTKGHYNPTNEPHPFHAGDLPSLFSNNGYSYMVVYTNRFKPVDVVGKTVVIHQNPDDYRTQPAGNTGTKIACGEIKRI